MISSSALCIRAAGPEDAASISAILQNSYPALMQAAYEPDVLVRALPLIVHANPALLRSGSYFVAEQDSHAVGCGGWTCEAPGTGDITSGLGHLRHFGTRAAAAGRGIGRMIYDRCAQQARANGIEAFLCFANLNAVPFYAALGFAEVERRDIPLAAGVFLPAMVMRRTLG
jgi:N-acetylglutamate synthase-like GNAT family acetyltransferase